MSDENNGSIRRWIFLPAGVISAALIFAAAFRPPNGVVGSDAVRLVGRLHMLALHMPIGLLLTLPVLEILGFFPKFKALKQSTAWILGFGTMGAVVTATMGYLLATSDGYQTSKLLSNHMWGGVMVACFSTMGFSAKIQHGAIWGRVYGLFLLLICAVLPLAAHEGGSLTHGANYLTQFLKPNLPEPPAGVAKGAFATQILPIFQQHCVMCHGGDKAKGGLRLDSHAELKKADESLLNKNQSELIRRITLSPDDEEAMPPGGKNRLNEKAIQAIKDWVEMGAGE
jgi:mono/diheme cytochrome c family protein/uncharacterized membrane protein